MILQIEFRAMGCHAKALLDAPAGLPSTQDALAQAAVWFETWEARLSRFRPDSELNRLNRSAGTWKPVSATLWSVLEAARQAEALSGSLVTPVILDALEAAGYTHSFADLPREQELPRPGITGRPLTGMSEVEMDEATHRVRLPRGMRLDLGGVGKGWAAHRAMHRLSANGPALVDAGGDIAISAVQRSGEPWLIGIDDPMRPGEYLSMLRVGRCGVATSGQDYRRWKQGNLQRHHIIDPRTGQPAETDVLTASVVAPTLLTAEAAAKVVFILGSQAGLTWLEAQPNLSGLVVRLSGEVIYGKGMERLQAPAGRLAEERI